MRVAWFSPLADPESYSAYASHVLLPLLDGKLEIDLYHDGFDDPGLGFPAYHYLSAARRHRKKPYDLCFYQVEDHPRSGFTRFHLGILPGVVLFHDILFTHEPPEALRHSPWEIAVEKFRGAPAEWPTGLVWPERKSPFGFREAALAVVALFSSEWTHGEFLRSRKERLVDLPPGRASSYLPFPVDVSALSTRRRERRGPLRAGFLGSPRVEDRSHKVMEAIAGSSLPVELVWLVGRDRRKAEEMAHEFGVTTVRFIEERTPERWATLLPELDVALHLSSSVFGSYGPYPPMTLSAGVPAVVTDFGRGDYLSERMALKTRPGREEALELRAAFEALAERGVDVSHALEYAKESFSKERVASELLSVLERSATVAGRASERWNMMQNDARVELSRRFLREIEECGAEELIGPAARELGWIG